MLAKGWKPTFLSACKLWLDAALSTSAFNASPPTSGLAQWFKADTGVTYDPPAASPPQTGHLKLWLKADAIAGSDGDALALWADSSGNGNDFVQAVGAAKPTLKTNIIGGKNVVRFDGSTDWMTSSFLSDGAKSVFIVSKMTAGTPSGGVFYTVFDLKGTARFTDIYFSDFTGYTTMPFKADTTSATGDFITAPFTLDTDAHVTGLVYDGGANNSTGSYVVTQDAVTQTLTASGIGWGFAGTNKCAIGATCSSGDVGSSFFKGDIAEILVYDTNLSAPDIALVNAYLRQKYGLQPANGVSVWNDQSGNVRGVVQPLGSAQPVYNANSINGLPGITYTGDQRLTRTTSPVSSGSARSVFAVLKKASNNGGNFVAFREAAPVWNAVLNQTVVPGECIVYSDGTSTYVKESPITIPSELIYEQYGTVGSAPSVYLNGVLQTTSAGTGAGLVTTDSGTDGQNIGNGQASFGDNHWDGDICEILIYNTSLSLSDRALVLSYLQGKYGISADSGPMVSAWVDQSGNGNDVSQATLGSRPYVKINALNGHPAIKYLAGKSLTNLSVNCLTAGSDRTIFAVARPSETQGGCLFSVRGGGVSGDSAWFILTLGGIEYFWSDGVGLTNAATPVDYTATPILVEYTGHVGTPPTTTINGSLITLGTASNDSTETGSTGFAVGHRLITAGSTQGWIGDIYEMLVFERLLTTPETLAVRKYLKNKYAI